MNNYLVVRYIRLYYNNIITKCVANAIQIRLFSFNKKQAAVVSDSDRRFLGDVNETYC
ncbi:MAG: hypothetical protein QXL94_07715 [Candidatus Parvarchaeum sp.]